MLIDDTLMLVTFKFRSVVSTRLNARSFDEVVVDQQQLNVRMGVAIGYRSTLEGIQLFSLPSHW
eukprot:scaffold16231_cov30-Phaeocystis_antarctica.AAC.1